MSQNNFYPTNRIQIDSAIVYKPLLDVRSKVDNAESLTDPSYWTEKGQCYLNEGQITYVATGNSTYPTGVYVCTNAKNYTWVPIGGSSNGTLVEIHSDGTINSSNYSSKEDGVYVAVEDITGVANQGDVVVISGGNPTVLNLNGVKFSNSSSWSGLIGYNGDELVKTDLNERILLAVGDGSSQYLGFLTIVDESDSTPIYYFRDYVGNNLEIYLNNDGGDLYLTDASDADFLEANEVSLSELDTIVISLKARDEDKEGTIDITNPIGDLITLNVYYKHLRELPASVNHGHTHLKSHQLTVNFPENLTYIFSGWTAESLDLTKDAPSISATINGVQTNWEQSSVNWKDVSHMYFNNKNITFIYNTSTLKAGWYDTNVLVIRPTSNNKIEWFIIDPKNVITDAFSVFAPIADVIPLWVNGTNNTKKLYVSSSNFIEYSEQA